jgi:hypothetical protein
MPMKKDKGTHWEALMQHADQTPYQAQARRDPRRSSRPSGTVCGTGILLRRAAGHEMTRSRTTSECLALRSVVN